MRKKVVYLFFVMLSGVLFYSCGPKDADIQKEVNAALTAIEMDSQVSATVQTGVATLTGTVQSEEAKKAAEDAVKDVKTVKSVVNSIEVVVPPPPVNPDDTLKTAVTTALTDAGFKDIVVEVKDGEVTLSGEAKKADEKKILDAVNTASPNKVTSNIALK